MKWMISIQLLLVLVFFQWHCSNSPVNRQGEESNVDYQLDKTGRIIGEISDSFKVPDLMVDQSQIYVWDKFLCKVGIYSKTNFKKIAEFGKKGEGPEEFHVIHSAYLDKDYIYVNSFPKLSIFSKNGKIVKELKVTTIAGDYKPIGKNYIGKKSLYTPPSSDKSKRSYVLFDANLWKIKDLIEVEYMNEAVQVNPQKVEILVYKDCTKGVVYKNKFYIGSTDRGFFFAVFDEEGKKLYEINIDYQRRKVTNESKKKIMNHIKEMKTNWEKFSETTGYYFPDFYPAYINFSICSNRIYVFTYPRRETPDLLEVLIFDLKGELIKRKSCISSIYFENLMYNRYYLYDGKVYFIEPVDSSRDDWEVFEIIVE
jgi:hypothetical protein